MKAYWSLYHMLLFDILPLYRHCVIVGICDKTFEKVSCVYSTYYYYYAIHLTYIYTYYFLLGSHAWIYVQHKNKKQHIICTICHTRCEHCTNEPMEGQDDCLKKYFFPVGNRPVLFYLSWSGTVTNWF